jgi:hypothetical protein
MTGTPSGTRHRPMGPRFLGTLADKLPTHAMGGRFFGAWGWVRFQNETSQRRQLLGRATDSARESACLDQPVEVIAIEEQSAHAGQRDPRQ